MIEPNAEDVRRRAEQDHAAARADAADRAKNQLSIADAAMKALMLANGGAMIALFTFVGNAMTRAGAKPLFDSASLRWAFGAFVLGLIAALAAHVFAFLSQDRFYNQAMHEVWRAQDSYQAGVARPISAAERDLNVKGQALYGLGVLAAVVSILLFALGCWCALRGALVG